MASFLAIREQFFKRFGKNHPAAILSSINTKHSAAQCKRILGGTNSVHDKRKKKRKAKQLNIY